MESGNEARLRAMKKMTNEILRNFEILELEPSASLEQVKQAYRDLAKVWHPDRFPPDSKLQRKAQERLKEINQAWETLEDFLSRQNPESEPPGVPPPESPPQASDQRAELFRSPATETPRKAGWRWGAQFLVLALYPLILGGLSLTAGRQAGGALLPPDTGALLQTVVLQLAIFALVFAVAWFFSRANADELLLRWRKGFMPLVWGVVYSVGLRILLFIVLLIAVLIMTGVMGWDQKAFEEIRPQTEQVIDQEALVERPAYLILNLTFVSFVFAGLREELWRAGMLTGLKGMWPDLFETFGGKSVAIVLVAVVFGLGHVSQGIGGVMLTTVLGVGLGAIMVFHKSIWEAALAHGFFDATTFALLYALQRFAPDLLPGGGG